MDIPFDRGVPEGFYWLNEPVHEIANGTLSMETAPETDFWQRTHYGFSRDNGHALLTPLSGDFVMTARTEFTHRHRYDQCGVLVRVDALNWVKTSLERENRDFGRLGSVVTNMGYSDWATTDVDAETDVMWYRVSCKDNDFILSTSADGIGWSQMRIAHLHNRQRPLQAGVYACSPQEGSFRARFSDLVIETT